MPLQADMNVIVSGLTAAGKTTHAKSIASRLAWKYVSASSIMLESAGLSAEQPEDFWVSPEGFDLVTRCSWDKIDDEMHKLEASGNAVFDTFTLGWHRTRPAMCIWLESDERSRAFKAIVSHQARARSEEQTRELVRDKDENVRRRQLERGRPDLLTDRAPFDTILDISSLITAPTPMASQKSIAVAESFLWAIIGERLGLEWPSPPLSVLTDQYGPRIVVRNAPST